MTAEGRAGTACPRHTTAIYTKVIPERAARVYLSRQDGEGGRGGLRRPHSGSVDSDRLPTDWQNIGSCGFLATDSAACSALSAYAKKPVAVVAEQRSLSGWPDQHEHCLSYSPGTLASFVGRLRRGELTDRGGVSTHRSCPPGTRARLSNHLPRNKGVPPDLSPGQSEPHLNFGSSFRMLTLIGDSQLNRKGRSRWPHYASRRPT